jgi:hypothetical protein
LRRNLSRDSGIRGGREEIAIEGGSAMNNRWLENDDRVFWTRFGTVMLAASLVYFIPDSAPGPTFLAVVAAACMPATVYWSMGKNTRASGDHSWLASVCRLSDWGRERRA